MKDQFEQELQIGDVVVIPEPGGNARIEIGLVERFSDSGFVFIKHISRSDQKVSSRVPDKCFKITGANIPSQFTEGLSTKEYLSVIKASKKSDT